MHPADAAAFDAAIKARLLQGADYAVCGIDDDYSRRIAMGLENDAARIETISVTGGGRGLYLSSAPSLRGDHNLQNALAAAAACRAFGLTEGEIAAGLNCFPGLAHRMQIVARRGKVAFVNDSKATNVGAAVRAIEAVSGRVLLLAGGVDKGGDYQPLRSSSRRAVRS